MRDPTQPILDTLHRNLQSIWDSDAETYRATTADDVSFFEWYISPQRIDGLDFHLRELRVHTAVVTGGVDPAREGEGRVEHELLQPRVQLYGDTAVVAFRLLGQAASADATEYLNTGTFVRRDDGWRAVAWQATRVPQRE